MKLKEAAGAEVTVELDENLISGGGHAFLYRAAAELTDLRRGLIRSIPGTRMQVGGGGWMKRNKRMNKQLAKIKVHSCLLLGGLSDSAVIPEKNLKGIFLFFY